jgi:hypothetical protein
MLLIREVGVIYGGMPVVFASYHDTSIKESNLICRTGLISGILTFAENIISPIEYFETDRFLVVFTNDLIQIEDNEREEYIIAYAVLDKIKKVDKILKRNLIPLLKKILKQFISKYKGQNLCEISKLKGFRGDLDKMIWFDTKTIDERVSSLISR